MKTDWTIKVLPGKITLVLGNTLMACCLNACDQAAISPNETAPKIAGDVITFNADNPQLKSILTANVEGPREHELQMPGRLVWDEDRTVRVFTPFAGRMAKIVGNVGDRVKIGQTLAELISPDFGQAQADARKARADLATKSAQWKRIQELAGAGVAAAKDLQQAESDYQSADAEFKRATARLSQFGDGNNVDQRFPLKSPIAGVIVEKNINPGQELRPDQPGSPLFVVTDPTRLWVQLDTNEGDLKNLKVTTPIAITSSSYPDETFTGELKQVADFIDPLSRTLKLRGSLLNADRRLKAEMFVNARIVLPKNDFPTVADKAVFLSGAKRYVFVKTATGTFVRRDVRVGTSYGAALPVLNGLKQGDEVVISGGLYLQQMLDAAGTRMDTSEPAQREPQGPPAAKSGTEAKK